MASIRASHADLVNAAGYASMTDVEKAEHLYFAAVAENKGQALFEKNKK